jgi:hypothetical protein
MMRRGPVSWVVAVTAAIGAVGAVGAVGALGVVALGTVGAAQAQRWDDATGAALGHVTGRGDRVEVADLDGDGWQDLVVASGGGDSGADAPAPQRVLRNLGNWTQGGAHLADVTASVLGAAADRLSRAIVTGDLDGDGELDLLVTGAHGTASGLFLRRGTAYDDVSASMLPAGAVAIADAALGDVDGDGDLDLLAADWGGDPLTGEGPVRLWLNDGTARFTAAPAERTPAATIAYATELELIDVDDDADLDVIVTCARCGGARLWLGDGTGRFVDASERLPAGAGRAWDVEAMDVDGDGDLDLATTDDADDGGDDVTLRERLLLNEGGRFEDHTAELLAGAANPANLPGVEDRALAFADVDADRDVDLIVGARGGADRVLRNDGAAGFTLVADALPLATPGTRSLALVDLDRDGRLDVVRAQADGEAPVIVQLAAAGNRADTAVALIRVLRRATPTDRRVVARVHDRRSDGRPTDWRRIVVEIGGPGTRPAIPMRWMGEHLYAATVPDEPGVVYRVCATDLAGNPTCARDEAVEPPSDAGADAGDGGEAPGGCCDAGDAGDAGGAGGAARARGSAALLAAVTLASVARRRRRRRSGARA